MIIGYDRFKNELLMRVRVRVGRRREDIDVCGSLAGREADNMGVGKKDGCCMTMMQRQKQVKLARERNVIS